MERQLLPRPEESPAAPPSASPSHTEASPTMSKRRKENVTPIACAECKRKKAKCDGTKPACRRCMERGVDCAYNVLSSAQRMTVLREQVKEYEAELKRLRIENAFLTAGPFNAAVSSQDVQADLTNPLTLLQEHMSGLPLGFMPLDTSSGNGLNIFGRQGWETDLVEAHRIMPHILFEEQFSGRCTSFYQESRSLLLQGFSPAIVLGGSVLNINTLLPSNPGHTSHRLSSWAVDFTREFPEDSLFLRIATAYTVFHLMRWLIHPTAESFAAIPDFFKPTLLQRCIPHPFWIEFVISPESRDTFIKHQDMYSYEDWLKHHTQTSIQWNGDLTSAIYLHPVTGDLQITAAFEATIRALSNWITPQSQSLIAPEFLERG